MRRFSLLIIVIQLLLSFTLPGQTIDPTDTVQYSPTDTVRANQLFAEMKTAIKQRAWGTAGEKGEQALTIYEQVWGEESVEVAEVHHQFGMISYRLGKYKEAEVNWLKALKIRKQLLPKSHPDLASSYNNLGVALKRQANYGSAITYYEKALSSKLAYYQYDHYDVSVTYNNLGNCYIQTGRYDQAIFYFEKTMAIRLDTFGNIHQSVAQVHDNLSYVYNVLGEYDEAIKSANKALAIKLKIYDENHSSLSNTYTNLGISYKKKGRFKAAITEELKALENDLTNLPKGHPEISGAYHNLGVTYYSYGDFDRALDLYNLAIEKLSKEHHYIPTIYNSIANVLTQLEKYSEAILIYEKALSGMIKIYGEDHHYVALLKNNIGHVLYLSGNYNEAINYLNASIEAYERLGKDHYLQMARPLNNLGVLHNRIGAFDEAITYYKTALLIKQSSKGNNGKELTLSNFNLGKSYHNKLQLDTAISYYLRALQAADYDKNDLSTANVMEKLVEILDILSRAYADASIMRDSINSLDKSYEYMLEALTAYDYQQSTLSTEGGKTFWQSNNYPVYEQAIRITLQKAEIEADKNLHKQTFTYAEKSKAARLQAQMKAADALAFADLPDSLLQRERDLRTDITWREKQRRRLLEDSKTETDTAVVRIGSILFDLRQRYDSLKNHLEQQYPKYYQAKYDLNTVDLAYVQDTFLRAGQSLVEYFVGDSSIFIFVVQKETFEVKEIKKDTAFATWVTDLTQEGIYGYYNAPAAAQSRRKYASTLRNYTSAASKLYEVLIAPVEDLLTDELIIIPDGILGYVPFEALLTEAPADYNDLAGYAYLLYDRRISYGYSATLLREMRERRHRSAPTQEILALAPFFGGKADTLVAHVDTTFLDADLVLKEAFQVLPLSGAEVKRIAQLLGGTAYYGPDATVELFQRLAPAFRILHLSTHAEADDRLGDYAYLAFGRADEDRSFSKLYARDLYNFTLNAEMVVLSACETGTGKLRRGEGIVSLARAFTYAGAKSIFTTLWKVEEGATKDLVLSFYKYLDAGYPKDHALHLAKVEYLQQHRDRDRLQHPFFWAGMIGIGEMSPLR